jgi:uncharacterized protein (DUF302 family)
MTDPAIFPESASVDGTGEVRARGSVPETVQELLGLIKDLGAKIFAVIDQAEEATNAGLTLRPTTLVLFGNPAAGTALMESAPLCALDLPLRVLVWQHEDLETRISYISADWFVQRYGLPVDLAGPLRVPERLALELRRT